MELVQFPSALQEESFKWEFYKGNELINNGNFSGEVQGNVLTLTNNQIVTSTKDIYTLYLWIDGNMENNSRMQNQPFSVQLKATGENALLEDKVSFDGIMYLANGDPCSECDVTLYSDPITTKTANDGSYSYASIPLGEHTIVVSKNDVELLRDNIEIKRGNENSYSSNVITSSESNFIMNINFESDKTIRNVTVLEKQLVFDEIINWGGSSHDYPVDAVESYNANGDIDGYVIFGYSGSENAGFVTKGYYDAVILKYDLFGNQQWIKNFGGSSGDHFRGGNLSYDVNGNVDGYVAVGETDSSNSGVTNNGNSDAILIKYDLFGNQQWIKSFGGSSGDYFRDVVVSYNSAGNIDGYIVIGNSRSTNAGFTSGGDNDAILVKYDLNGNQQWIKNFGGSSSDEFNSIINSYNNAGNVDGYIMSGNSRSTNAGFTNGGNSDAILVKYDLNGNQQWIKSFGGAADDYTFNSSYSYETDGHIDGYMILGRSHSVDAGYINKGNSDAILIKYDLFGNQQFVKTYGGNSIDQFNSILPSYTTSGRINGYVVAGYTLSTDLSFSNRGEYDALILKTDLNGNEHWVKDFGGTSNDIVSRTLFVSNKYLFIGSSSSNNAGFTNNGGDDTFIAFYK